MNIKETIKVLKIIEDHCITHEEGKPLVGTLSYSVGGINSKKYNFPKALSSAIQALENKPSIKELKAEFRARNKWYYQYLAGEISIGKFCDLLAEAIYNFRRGK